MMLEYDWGNPASAAAAMMLFVDDGGQDHRQQVFDHQYGHQAMTPGDFFPPPTPISAAELFPGLALASSCQLRYGMGLPPDPTRIGLNLGVRTYFSSGSPADELAMARPCRRRARISRCQADGCGVELTHAKHYHRRHKVCEFHSKTSIVIVAGLSQRFCQQCSRFHAMSEFDQGKRSCRKRLADHNRRRRKSQDLTTTTTVDSATNETTGIAKSLSPEKILFATATTTTTTSNISNNNNADPSSSVTRVSSPAPPGMAAPIGTTSPRSVSFLSQLGEFRGGNEQRLPSWAEAEEAGSIRGFSLHK